MDINENNICHRRSTNVEVVNGQDLSVQVNDIHKSKPSENNSNESSVATEDRVNEIIKLKVKKKPMVPLPSKLPYGKQTRVSALEDAHKDISIVNQYSQETSRNVDIMQHEQTADKQLPISIDTCIPKQTPKLKAVKIKEEEIYEGKPEYTNECNLHPQGIELSTRESLVKLCVEGEQMLTDLAKLHIEFTHMSTVSEKLHVESNQMQRDSKTDAVIKKRIPTSVATGKHMIKSKTFSAFQDLRNKSNLKLQTQKCDLKTANATRTPAQSVCKIPKPKSCIEFTTDANDKGGLRFDQKRNFDSIKRNADTNKKEYAHERKTC